MVDVVEICAECERGTLVPTTYADSFQHEGIELPVENLEGMRCTVCGAESVSVDQFRRNRLKVVDAKRVHDDLLTTSEVRNLRERVLRLTQADAAKVFGGGINAFSKYERGEIAQTKAMDLLMRVSREIPAAAQWLTSRAGLSPNENFRGIGRLSFAPWTSFDPSFSYQLSSLPDLSGVAENDDESLHDWRNVVGEPRMVHQ